MALHRIPAFVAATFLALATAIAAQAAERSIIVLDASGSMWGQIGDRTKIEIARETLGDVLKAVPAESELGLMVYGHRETGSCSDIELAVPPAGNTAEAIAEYANSLNPKGKTPLSDAVRQAAEALRFTEEKATVILVTDGLETCNADPCTLGRELEKSGVDFTAHVVAFGLSDEEGRKVACLAEETGGKYLKAEDAKALGEALTTTVVQATPEAEPEPAPEPTRPEFNVVVQAKLAADTPIGDYGNSVRWDYYPIDEAGKISRKSTYGTYGGNDKLSLPAGRYEMRARLGKVDRRREIDVTETGVFETEVVLDAAIVEVVPKRTAEDAEGTRDAWVNVQFGDAEDGGYGTTSFFVAAGEVKINGRIGKARAEETITVAAGDTVSREMILASGVVVPGAVYAEGGPAVEINDIRFVVRTAKADLKGKRQDINSKYGPGGTIDVSAGEVVLWARLGKAEVTSEPFMVEGGKATEVTVNIDAGVLAIAAPDAYRIGIFNAKKDINGKLKRIDGGYGGDYIVEVTYEGDKAKKQATVTVTAGERTEATIE